VADGAPSRLSQFRLAAGRPWPLWDPDPLDLDTGDQHLGQSRPRHRAGIVLAGLGSGVTLAVLGRLDRRCSRGRRGLPLDQGCSAAWRNRCCSCLVAWRITARWSSPATVRPRGTRGSRGSRRGERW